MSATASQKAVASDTKEPSRIDVWDLPLRLFHWLLVLAVAVAFLSSEEDSPLNVWHVLAGWVAGVLIVFRLVWGFVGGEHSRFADFVRPSRVGEHISGLLHRRSERTLGHNPLGGLSVILLLALAAATVLSGAFGGEGAEDFHELIAWTLLAFVGLHVAAVVAMSVLERENLVAAMITGKKPGQRHPRGANARPPGLTGVAVAMVVLALTVYGILSYDPHAFTLRRAEAFEQRASSNGEASRTHPDERDND